MSKYVFFDIDGTLWDEDMIVPESTKEAIRQLQANGHKAFICTGRAMGNVNDPQFVEIGFDGFVASCGNHIQMNGEILLENLMTYDEIQKVYDLSREQKMAIIYEGTDYQWLDRHGFSGDSYVHYIIENLRHTIRFLDETDLGDIRANKFSGLATAETDLVAMQEALKDSFELLDHGSYVIEAVPVGTSKATGIKWLCEHFNIPVEDTYAIGDSINDIEMLKFVGHSIAMGNATPVAKEAAEYITTDLHEDGIKNALEHYGLI